MTVRSETGLGLPDPRLFERNPVRRGSGVRRVVAVAALLGAPLAGVVGALLDVDRFVAGASTQLVAYAANALLLAVIPLLMLGAVMLDTLEDDLAARHELRSDETLRPALRLVQRSGD